KDLCTLVAGNAWKICDVSYRNDGRKLFEATIRWFGHLDIVVNNAAVLGPVGPVVAVDAQAWQRAIEIDLYGVFLCSKEALKHMMRQRSGKIINLSGGGAASPRKNLSAYASAKAAVVRFTETLAEEVSEYNIQVNAIAPGAVSTAMTKDIIKHRREAGKSEVSVAQQCLAGRGASVDSAAGLAVFLASGASNHITGKLISAQWDDWRRMGPHIKKRILSSMYTLRRIDGKNFKEVRRA
nr:SDR family oxidoreductase [Candidatus Omnitrophota bacterium]